MFRSPDTLPTRRYVDRLVLTEAQRSRFTLPPKFGSPLLGQDDVDRFYEAALSVEWPSGWEPRRTP